MNVWTWQCSDVFSKVSMPGSTKIGHVGEVFTRATAADCIRCILFSIFLPGHRRSKTEFGRTLYFAVCYSHKPWTMYGSLIEVASQSRIFRSMSQCLAKLFGCHLILTNNEGSLRAKTCFPLGHCATPLLRFWPMQSVRKLMVWLGPWLLWNSCLDLC